MQEEVKFSIIPRFYLLNLSNKLLLDDSWQEIKNLMQLKLKDSTSFPLESVEYNRVDDFKFKTFDQLGFIEIRFLKISYEKNYSTDDIYKISLILSNIIELINDKYSEALFLDEFNDKAYLVNIAVDSNQSEPWTKEIILKNSHSLGKWIEFYSGQWDDYSEDLWLSRIENNLSNRLSELHFIRTNSAFLYIPEQWWNGQGGKDMEKYFIEQIIQVKALVFCYYILNEEIDKTNDKLEKLKDIPLKILENEIEKVIDFENLVHGIGDRLFKQRIINRRSHAKKILETSLKLLEIDMIREETSKKILRLKSQLVDARAIQQEKLSQQQKRWLLLLNFILGSQVAFTFSDKLKELLNVDGLLYEFLGENTAKSVMNIIDPIIWLAIIILVTIGVTGILYTFLTKKLGLNFTSKSKISE